jgi:hypothetical protein
LAPAKAIVNGGSYDGDQSLRAARPRAACVHFTGLATRWMDNGAYGYIDNVICYSF